MLEQFKKYAIDTHVPIISDEGLLFLKLAIEKHHVKDVLEIGSAIGYSATAMASFGCKVDTFERDEFMISEARKHIELYDVEHQVTLYAEDALKFQGELRSYDLIFIDAAKAQYQKFFEKYTPYLRPNGIVICDNLSFHNLQPEQVNRHTKQLLKKIERFKQFLETHPIFETKFYTDGDGMSVSIRKNI